MPFRSKCPYCGRRQTFSDAQPGQSVWCSACGGRFQAIPDIGVDDLPEPVAQIDQSIAPLPPPPPLPPAPTPFTPPTLSPHVFQPLVPPQVLRPFVASPSLVPATTAPRLVHLGIATVLGVGLLLAVGVFILGTWFGGRKQIASETHAPTAVPMVAVKMSSPATAPNQSSAAQPNTRPAAPPQIAVADTQPSIPPPPFVAVEKPAPSESPKLHPVHAPVDLNALLDEQIGKAIDRGVAFLLGQFQGGQLRNTENADPEVLAGMDAIAVYALLQAGEATHDPKLTANSLQVGQMLDVLKKFPMEKEYSTYSRSLRAAALGVYHREADKLALRADASWLMADAQYGAYTYQPDPKVHESRGSGRLNASRRDQYIIDWDNSNSQYGALGVWAALEAGVEIPNSFWTEVQKHWLGCQLPDGEWAYRGYGDFGRLSMTVAGITTLLVTEDQLDARSIVPTLGHPPFTPALQKGLNWLEAGDNSVRVPAGWRTYNLFGLERAALASGFKYFGEHDWYRELAREQLARQDDNGSWSGSSQIIDTSYTLLFLSRGRHPIFMNKLRFDTYWANRPRDVANLAHYATTILERPINWQVVSFKSDWSDWMDSPILYIASHEALKFNDAQIDKLRQFALNGGLIFTHADGDAPAFNKSMAELSHKLFPDYPLADLPSTHPIFSTLYKIKQPSRFQGISNGSRLLLLHSPTDLNKSWQQRDSAQHAVNFQMGVNIFLYAAGKANLRNKLKTPIVPEPTVTPILKTQLARLTYTGSWNPEPAAWPRFSRLFQQDTSVKLNVIDAEPSQLDSKQTPFAQLSGTAAVHYDAAQLKALHDYVDSGGVLIIDATGGADAFRKSILTEVIPRAFVGLSLQNMPPDDPVFAGTGDGMTPVALKLRPFRGETDGATTEPLQELKVGKGTMIFSDVDITTALLGTNTWAVDGYTPDAAYDLVRNVILFQLEKE